LVTVACKYVCMYVCEVTNLCFCAQSAYRLLC